MKYFLPVFFLVISLQVFSQTGVVRLEFEAPVNSDIYKLVPCAGQGLLLFYETRDIPAEGSKTWYFTFYDADLQEVWKAPVPVISGAEYQDYAFSDSLLYLFFLNSGKVKTGNENFQFLILDLNQGISVEKKGSLPAESNFERLIIRNSKAYIAVGLKNDQAAVYTFDFDHSDLVDFTIVYPDQNFIEDLVFDPYHEQLVAVVSNFLSRKQSRLYLIFLSPEGIFQHDMEIAPVLSSKFLNTARVHPLEIGSLMVTGTYGSLSGKIPSGSDYFGIESTGVFSTRITDRRQEFMNYYNFIEFRNLRAGVSARDFYRLQKKKVRESAEYSLNYEVLTHDLVFHDSNFVILLEAFYPEFRTVSDMSYDYWGRPVTNTYTVFEGFRFFNSIMAGFNMNGELAWDNSIEINIPITKILEKRTSFYFDEKPVLLFYNDGSKLSYRVCFKNKSLVSFSRLPLETSERGDNVTATGINRVQHWFDHYFLAYGYHTIRNNTLPGRNERSVFYINKLSLE